MGPGPARGANRNRKEGSGSEMEETQTSLGRPCHGITTEISSRSLGFRQGVWVFGMHSLAPVLD